MATDLTNVAVSTGYVQLLHIDGGVGGSATRVYDGDGTGTPLEISTTEVVIKDGSFNLDVASHDGTNGLKLGGTLVTTSAAELNLLDGITAGTVSASKFLLVDSNKDLSGLRNLTATGTIQAANFTGTGNTQIGDAVADTVAMNATITTNLVFEGSTANAYETTLAITDPTADRTWTIPDATDTSVGRATTDTLTNKTLTAPDINTPDIDGGTVDAITSLTVANNVDIGSYDLRAGTLTADGLTSGRVVFASTNGVLSDDSDLSFSGATLSATNLTSSGTVTYGSLSDGSITITAFVDEDGMDSNSATLVPTQQSVKAYVDAQVTAQDLDLTTDSGTIAIDLDSETLTLTGGTGVDTSASSNTVTFALDLNELTTETSIADADFIAMVDATDSGSGKITFENLEDAIFSSVSGDVLITEAGVASIQANSVALATDTTGDYVQNITAGTGLTSTGATSGENIAHSLSVDASQAQVTTVGTLNSGAISSGFGAIDIGSSNLTTTGTVSLGATSFSGAIDFNSQNMTEVDIDSGTIDGATIATSDITVGSGKTLDVSAGTLTLAANQISGDKVEGGTIAATTISSLTTAGITASANIDIGAYDLRAATITADGLTSGRVVFAGTNGVLSDDSDLTFSGSTLTATNVAISGTLTTTGSVQEVSTTNLNVEDPLILLNKYDSQPGNNLFDAGIIIKRGSSDSAPANVGIIWDESADTFSFVDTSEDGTTAGNVSITDYENLRVGALTADDASTLATGSTIGNLTLANGSITDSSGAISFGDENLSTTGTFSAEHLTSTDDLTVSGLATIGETLGVTGIATFTAQSVHNGGLSTGALVMNDGSITDTSGAISFGDENLTTSGTLGAGVITATGFTIGSAVITEAELEILDGLTVTTDELNIMDGSATTQATVTLAGTDGVVISDGDVMKQALVSDFEVYMEANLDTMGSQFTSASSLATVGALSSGSIASGFGTINNGANTITTTGTVSTGALTVGGNIDFNSGTIDLSTQTVDVTLNGAVDALNFDSNTLSIDALNNRVGIGTNSVSSDATLGVDGNIELKSAGNKYWIPRQSDGAITGSLYSRTGNTITLSGAGSSGGAIEFIPSSANSSAVAMTIDSSQNVGIGTSSPSSKLHLGGVDSGAQGITWQSGTSGTNYRTFTTSTFSSAAEGNYLSFNIASGQTTQTSDVLYLRGDGRVGIGTSSPSQLLTVSSTSADAILAIDCGHASSNAILIIESAAGRDSKIKFTEADTTKWEIYNDGSDSDILKISDDGDVRVAFDQSGNVGIGTASPLNLLHISQASANTAMRIGNNGNYDQYVYFNGGSDWSVGMDYSNTNAFSIANASSLGSGHKLVITTAGKVGIGTTSPASTQGYTGILEIGNASDTALVLHSEIGGTANKWEIGNNTSGVLQFAHSIAGNGSTGTKMVIDGSGNVGIGTASPDTLLVIGGDSGTGRILPSTDNVGYIGESSHRWQAIYAVNGSIQTSDERQKTEITDTSLGLGFIKQLRPVSYKWKVGGYDVGDGVEIELEPEEVDSEGNVIKTAVRGLPKKEEIAGKRNHYGLIAQEVKEVLGDTDFGGWVIDDLDDSESTQSLRYDQFISPLIKAVQELSTANDALKSRIETLENA